MTANVTVTNIAAAPQTLFWGCILGLFYMFQAGMVILYRIKASTFNAGVPVEIDDVDLGMRGGYGKTNSLIWKIFSPVIRLLKFKDEKEGLAALARIQRAQLNSSEYFPIWIVLSLTVEMHLTEEKSLIGTLNLIFLIARICGWFGLAFNSRVSWGRIIGASSIILFIWLCIKGLTISAAIAFV